MKRLILFLTIAHLDLQSSLPNLRGVQASQNQNVQNILTAMTPRDALGLSRHYHTEKTVKNAYQQRFKEVADSNTNRSEKQKAFSKLDRAQASLLRNLGYEHDIQPSFDTLGLSKNTSSVAEVKLREDSLILKTENPTQRKKIKEQSRKACQFIRQQNDQQFSSAYNRTRAHANQQYHRTQKR